MILLSKHISNFSELILSGSSALPLIFEQMSYFYNNFVQTSKFITINRHN